MATFINELKRRNVFKVGIAYAIVAWILIEVTVTVLPTFNAPAWISQVFVFFIILGFPIALIFAWAFELTPDGVKPTSSIDNEDSITHVTSQKLNYAIIALLVLALGFVVIDQYVLDDDTTTEVAVEQSTSPSSEIDQAPAVTPTTDDTKSIAVLPFVNMSADPEQEYFSDGISEEILNGLAQVADLRVAARTSAFSFKGQNIDIRKVGETLNVNHVLEGSVRKAGNRLRITAQLIKVEDGYHLWSETFDREMDDIFAIQDEIARAVVSAMEATLGLGDDTPLVRQGTTNIEAYNWYLRGRYYIERQTPEAFDKAIDSYSQAIALDPEFAGGHGGMAYGMAYGSAFFPYANVADTVRTGFQRALAIDENQTEALLAKAVDAALTNYDYLTAERSILKALKTGVNKTLITDAYWWIVLSAPQRRFDEAIDLLRIVEVTDPLSPLVKQGIGFNLMWSRDYQAAVPYLQTAIELNPNDFLAHNALILSYIGLARWNSAESAIKQLEVVSPSDTWPLFTSALLYIAKGDETSGRLTLERMVEMYNDGNVEPILAPVIAIVYGKLNEVEEALTWIELAVETPSPFNGLTFVDLHDRPEILNHPRFQAMFKKINLDDASIAASKAAASR
jgi:TolB-like protein